MKTMEMLFYPLIWMLLLPITLVAEVHSYDPYSAIYLGAGFDPKQPEEAFNQCITFDATKNVDTIGAIKTTFDATIIHTRENLHRHLGISSSASARYKFFSGSAAMSFHDDYNFHSDSIVWIIKGQSFYGRFQMINPQLTKEAQQLIDDKKYSSFARKCGTKFVSQENRSVLIAAIFSIENVSSEYKQKLTAEFKASVSGGLFEGRVASSYKRFFSEASKRSQIKMSVYAIGGNGITRLHNLMTKNDDLNNIQLILSNYTKTIGSDHAAPLSYLSGSMEVFGWRGQHDPQVKQRDHTLSQIYFRYKEAETVINRLNEVLILLDTPLWSFLSDEQYKTYQYHLNEYETYLSLLTETADNCFYGDQCSVPPQNLKRVKWPLQLADKCELKRIEAFNNGKITLEIMTLLRRSNMVPLFKVPDDPTSEYIGMANCSYIL